jgi:hypothetical protein
VLCLLCPLGHTNFLFSPALPFNNAYFIVNMPRKCHQPSQRSRGLYPNYSQQQQSRIPSESMSRNRDWTTSSFFLSLLLIYPALPRGNFSKISNCPAQPLSLLRVYKQASINPVYLLLDFHKSESIHQPSISPGPRTSNCSMTTPSKITQKLSSTPFDP